MTPWLSRLEVAALVCVAIALPGVSLASSALRTFAPGAAMRVAGMGFHSRAFARFPEEGQPPVIAVDWVDPWGRPNRVHHPMGGAQDFYSVGPNGIDERLGGDDLRYTSFDPWGEHVVALGLLAHSRPILLLTALSLAWFALWTRYPPRDEGSRELLLCGIVAAVPLAVTLLVLAWARTQWWSTDPRLPFAPRVLSLHDSLAVSVGLAGFLLAILVRRAAPERGAPPARPPGTYTPPP